MNDWLRVLFLGAIALIAAWIVAASIPEPVNEPHAHALPSHVHIIPGHKPEYTGLPYE